MGGRQDLECGAGQEAQALVLNGGVTTAPLPERTTTNSTLLEQPDNDGSPQNREQ